MRSLALLALLALAVADTAITKISYVPPTGTDKFGTPAPDSAGAWIDTVTATPTSYSYTPGSQAGANLFFRVTVFDCEGTNNNQKFKTTVKFNDGSTTLGVNTGGGTSNSATVNWQRDSSNQLNTTILIATGADTTANAPADIAWHYTVTLDGDGKVIPATQKCHFYADFVYYGKSIQNGAIGKDGNPGDIQDAWVPCCDSVESSYQVTPANLPHKYLEVAATVQAGSWKTVGLTNPGSVIKLTDTTTINSDVAGKTATARTCLSNQSCEILAEDYYVILNNNGVDYADQAASDFHLTFTLTTKAGVATASASIAFAVAALFALFH